MEAGYYALEPGERLLWTGKPSHYRLAGFDWAVLLFGLCWVIITLALTSVTFRTGRQVPPLGILGFGAFGVVGTWGRVGVRRRSLRHSAYLLTDRRVATARPGNSSGRGA